MFSKKVKAKAAAHSTKAGIYQKEAHQHATKIQAVFRGYKVRKELKEKKLQQNVAQSRKPDCLPQNLQPTTQDIKSLVKEFSREVLRQKPENIYEFLADYVEFKVLKRDGKGKELEITLPSSKGNRSNSWKWMVWGWQGSSQLTQEELQAFLKAIHMDYNKADHAARVIQCHARGYLARKRVTDVKKERSRLESVWSMWVEPCHLNVNPMDTDFILAHYGLTLEEANEFATKIQAAVRGFLTRSGFVRENPKSAAHLTKAGIPQADAHHQHATKIQSLFRGYKARKELKEQRLQKQQERLSVIRGKLSQTSLPRSSTMKSSSQMHVEAGVSSRSRVTSKGSQSLIKNASSVALKQQSSVKVHNQKQEGSAIKIGSTESVQNVSNVQIKTSNQVISNINLKLSKISVSSKSNLAVKGESTSNVQVLSKNAITSSDSGTLHKNARSARTKQRSTSIQQERDNVERRSLIKPASSKAAIPVTSESKMIGHGNSKLDVTPSNNSEKGNLTGENPYKRL